MAEPEMWIRCQQPGPHSHGETGGFAPEPGHHCFPTPWGHVVPVLFDEMVERMQGEAFRLADIEEDYGYSIGWCHSLLRAVLQEKTDIADKTDPEPAAESDQIAKDRNTQQTVLLPARWYLGMDGNAHPSTGPDAEWVLLLLQADGTVTWHNLSKEGSDD